MQDNFGTLSNPGLGLRAEPALSSKQGDKREKDGELTGAEAGMVHDLAVRLDAA